MTVKELKNVLACYPEDREVVLSKDAAGNGYSKAYQVDNFTYYKDSAAYDLEHVWDEEYSEDDVVKAVIIWPV
jgi:hypothetical protein